MKDSGVEWLGEVPEHWPTPSKLSRIAAPTRHSFVNGPFGSDLLTSEITDEGVPVLYIRDISGGKFIRCGNAHVTYEKALQLNFCRVKPGDILVAKVGTPPGITAIYPDGEPIAIITQDVIRIRPNLSIVSGKYVAYFLNSASGIGLIDNISIESTRMRISLGDYKNSYILAPPLTEQVAIVAYLDRETAKIDALTTKVEAAIGTLQEYRSALITAAVTGKIDVREAIQ